MPPRSHLTGRGPHKRLGLESLEERTLLSATPLPAGYDADHILVRFHTPAPQAVLAGTTVGRAIDADTGLYRVELAPGVGVDAALAAYRADSRVALADPDYHIHNAAVPNDTRFSEQWALRNLGQAGGKRGADIRATAAWDTTRGSMRTVVSVMDTGIDYRHPDLYQNIWVNQKEIPAAVRTRLIDTDGDGLISFRDLNDRRNQGTGKITDLNRNGFIDGGDILRPVAQGGWADGRSQDGDRYVDDLIGWDFVNNDNNPSDDHGHGTHVAGIIGATGNNGRGVTGVAWSVSLLPVKFISGSGAGAISRFIEGLNYAVAKGARISNNSWTGAGSSTALTGAIRNAGTRGHIFVAAAGNRGENNDLASVYPASFGLANIVSVAATDRRDRLAGFSNYGRQSVDLAAPGADILSTVPGGGYASNSGTSMATPHVTGALALVASQHPGWTYQQIIGRVRDGADRLPALAGKVATGGRLNVAAAVGARQAAPAPPHVVVAVAAGLPQNKLTSIRVTFNRAVLPSTFGPADIRLLGPGGRAVAITAVRVVASSGNRAFDITFAAQTVAGAYSLRVGPEVTDASQVKMAVYTATYQVRPPVTPPPAPRVVSAVGHGLAQNKLTSIRVTFDRAVALSTFTAADVGLVGPGGRRVTVAAVRAVSGTGDRVFDITFAAQTTAGTYSLRVGPEVMGVNGGKMTVFATAFQVPAVAPRPAPRVVSAVATGLAQNKLTSIRVTFDRAIDLSTFTVADVALVGPGSRAVRISGVKAVVGSAGRAFDVTFAAQTVAGTYTLRIGSDVRDVAGTKLTAYATAFQLRAAPQPGAATYTSSTTAAIVPGGRAVSLLTVNSDARIGDVNVKLNITHPRISDLYVHLVAPDGTRIVLFNRSGGRSANLTNTLFDDQARQHIALGAGPFTGAYQPVVPLSNLNGKLVRGTWKLWVEDRGGSSRGTLVNWSLMVRARA